MYHNLGDGFDGLCVFVRFIVQLEWRAFVLLLIQLRSPGLELLLARGLADVLSDDGTLEDM